MSKIVDGILKDIKHLPDMVKDRLSDMDIKKVIILASPYMIVAYLVNKMSYQYRNTEGTSFDRLSYIFSKPGAVFKNPLPSIYGKDILYGLIAAGFLYLALKIKRDNAKKFRRGIEYGSAKWGSTKDIRPFIDETFENNIILTQTEYLRMTRAKSPGYEKNKNVLIIGGSGSGKTRFFIKPNIMQLHSSYVVTDPKGTVLIECGKMLENAGYKIKVFNTINFKKSMRYNPFMYIRNEDDILTFVDILVQNTKGEGDKSSGDFWEKAEKLYYNALIAYIWYEAPVEEQNFAMLIDLLNASEVREEDESFKNAVDLLFEDLAKKDPDNFAVSQYTKYKLAAGKTAKSILISCAARLAPFDIGGLRDLTSVDELNLMDIAKEREALFVIISDTNATYNFLVSIMYSQMFNHLCDLAFDVYNGELPQKIRFLLDEFSNIGLIPNFDKLIATIRSRGMSACIVLQSKAQLKAIYKDNAQTIEDNCDATLFLGGKGKDTIKDLVEMLGKETIDVMNTSETKGNSPSNGLNYSKVGKELMTADEIATMDGGKCILQIRGVYPFFSNKFDITKHKRYPELSDYDKKNEFDIEGYIKDMGKIRKITPNDTVDEVVDLGIVD